ncbi:hypothetical protein ANANG_G00079290 [Anguilla anguilla]|uniref:Uncharacterized protein n=1 Tax=Anguilla anguilla TaxID=7936 RepID=A0A9D3MPH6_ANGAN|nr:hypothetical protein ANANG_G00079290 [Anguilla anguilla]
MAEEAALPLFVFVVADVVLGLSLSQSLRVSRCPCLSPARPSPEAQREPGAEREMGSMLYLRSLTKGQGRSSTAGSGESPCPRQPCTTSVLSGAGPSLHNQ